jgi:hypothetical protein
MWEVGRQSVLEGHMPRTSTVTHSILMGCINPLHFISTSECVIQLLQHPISHVAIMAKTCAGSLSCHQCWLLHTASGPLVPHCPPNSCAFATHFTCQFPPPVFPSQLLVSALLVILCLLPRQTMPRQRGKPKRSPTWYQAYGRNVPRILGQPQPSPISSPSPTSTHAMPDFMPPPSFGQHDLIPLSSPGACQVEWFDSHRNSLDFNPSIFPNLPTTSHLPISPITPRLASLPSATSLPSAATPSQPPSPTCCACGDFSWLLAELENLQSLVFDIRQDVANLMLRRE